MARPNNMVLKEKADVWISKAAKDFAGRNLSLHCQHALDIEMGRAHSLDEVKIRVMGNLDNIHKFTIHADKKTLSKGELATVQESIGWIRKYVSNLEGIAVSRKDR